MIKDRFKDIKKMRDDMKSDVAHMIKNRVGESGKIEFMDLTVRNYTRLIDAIDAYERAIYGICHYCANSIRDTDFVRICKYLGGCGVGKRAWQFDYKRYKDGTQ